MSHGISHRAAHKLRADRRQIFAPTATAFGPPSSPTPSQNPHPPVQPDPPTKPNPPGRPPVTSDPNAIPTHPNPNPPVQQPTSTSTSLSTSLSSSSSVTPTSTSTSTTSSSITPTPLLNTIQTSLTVAQPTIFVSQPPVATFGPPSVSSSPSPTAIPPASSGGMSTGTVVGIAAAGLAGLAVLGAVGVWAMKRYFRNDDEDMDPNAFSRNSWMRNSVAIQDDDTSAATAVPRGRGGPSPTPRPPTMIERRANLAGRGGFAQPGFQGAGYPDPQGGYNQYNDYPSSQQPYSQQYAPQPMGGYMPDQQQPYPPPGVYQGHQQYYNPIAAQSPFEDPATMQQAPGSGAATPVYFSRQNSIQSADPVLSPYNARGGSIDNDGYATLDRTATPGSPLPNPYNDRNVHTGSPLAINTDAPSSPRSPSFKAMPLSPSVVNVPDGLHEGRATPVQFGYSAEEAAAAAQAIAQPAPAVMKDSSAKRLSMSSRKSGRPETIYDEEDAYGGI